MLAIIRALNDVLETIVVLIVLALCVLAALYVYSDPETVQRLWCGVTSGNDFEYAACRFAQRR